MIRSPGRCSPLTAVYVFPLRLKRRCETCARRALALDVGLSAAATAAAATRSKPIGSLFTELWRVAARGGGRGGGERSRLLLSFISPLISCLHSSASLSVQFAQVLCLSVRPGPSGSGGVGPQPAGSFDDRRRRDASSAWGNNYSWPAFFSCNGGKSNVGCATGQCVRLQSDTSWPANYHNFPVVRWHFVFLNPAKTSAGCLCRLKFSMDSHS